MKFRKVNEPAYREYHLALVRPNGERVEDYLPYVWRSLAQAQRECDTRNARRTVAAGRLAVAWIDRPASVAYVGTLKL